MFRSLLLLVLLVGPAFAQPRPLPSETKLEIDRRGYMVEIIDSRISNTSEGFAQALGVPEDDSHKFFLTILEPDFHCPHCKTLKRTIAEAPEMQKWAIVETLRDGDIQSTEESWAHVVTEPYKNPFKPDKWKKIDPKGYPIVLIQVPLNGQYGKPGTVVNCHYGAMSGPKLDKWMYDSLKKYFSHRKGQGQEPEEIADPPFPLPNPGPAPDGPMPNFPDMVPLEPEFLPFEKIAEIIPDAPLEYVLQVSKLKPKSAAEVMQGYMLKKLQDELDKLRAERGNPVQAALPGWLYAALAFLFASPLFWKLLGMAWTNFVIPMVSQSPNKIDDLVAKKVEELLQKKIDSFDPPPPPKL
jgi:hypothetical protein